MKSKNMLYHLLQNLVKVNLYLSAILVIVFTINLMNGNDVLFSNLVEIYGALANNLRFVVLYLALTEVSILMYTEFKKNYHAVKILGCFYILLIGSIDYYININQIHIDQEYGYILLYVGLSHIIYGFIQSFSFDQYLRHS